jgi:hypothetical protein
MGLMNFPRYIGREGRDFFYLTLRYVLPGEPLASAGKADEGDGQWQVKGLPQHGFPYALAKTSVALASKQRVRVLQVDPRMVTTRREQAVENEGEPAVLAVANVTGQGELSLWQSNAAFSVGATPLAPGSVRIVSGARRADRAAAAVGVRTESGMLVYVEAVGEDGKAAGAELTALLESLGCELPLLLGEPLALALGGDTDLAGEGVRLPPADEQVVLWRRARPSCRSRSGTLCRRDGFVTSRRTRTAELARRL